MNLLIRSWEQVAPCHEYLKRFTTIITIRIVQRAAASQLIPPYYIGFCDILEHSDAQIDVQQIRYLPSGVSVTMESRDFPVRHYNPRESEVL